MLRKSVETRDWLNTIEPRNVRAVMKRVVEDITAIDSLVIIWEFLSTVVSMTITRLFNTKILKYQRTHMSHFAYACKTERQNGISRLISELLHTLNSLRDRLFHVTEWTFPNSLSYRLASTLYYHF